MYKSCPHLASVRLAAGVIHSCPEPSQIFPQLLGVCLTTPGQHVFPVEEYRLHLVLLPLQITVPSLGEERERCGLFEHASENVIYLGNI